MCFCYIAASWRNKVYIFACIIRPTIAEVSKILRQKLLGGYGDHPRLQNIGGTMSPPSPTD